MNLKLKDVFEDIEDYKGWLYVKGNEINLQSECFFYVQNMNMSNDEEKAKRKGLIDDGWNSTLQKEDIEDIIENAMDQIPHPSVDDYLKAFKYYFENDAFIDFDIA